MNNSEEAVFEIIEFDTDLTTTTSGERDNETELDLD